MYSSSRSDPVRATLSQIVLCCTVITGIDNDTGCLSVLISVSNLVSAHNTLLLIPVSPLNIYEISCRAHTFTIHYIFWVFFSIEISAFL